MFTSAASAAPVPGRGKDDDRTAGLEDRAQASSTSTRQRGELRPAVIDDRMVHGPQHPVGNVGRPWDLEKMPTRTVHRPVSLQEKRFYGPEKTFFDKVWMLGDIEEVKP